MKHRNGIAGIVTMLFAALSLIVAVAMSSAVFAEADVRSEVLPDGAAYIDENGNTKILARDQFRIVGLDTDENPVEFENGWYVLYGVGDLINRIEIKGDVKLLLMNESSIDFESGIHVPKGSSLSIYGQSTDRDTSGVLIARGEKAAAGIGSNITPSIDKPDDCGIINVYGGVIRAEGGEGGAGIGGGYGLIKYDVEYGGDGGTYYQKYGWVEAVGGKSAAGVGGGRRGDSGTVTIDGGTLEATGGEAGAGIGGGEALVNSSNFNSGGNSTFITINGGVVRAFGSGGGAGIGAGKGANGTKGGYDDPMDKRGCIKITGGNVTAFGSEGGAGIGGALNDINDWYEFAAGANVDISGGYINAKGGAEAAGIGSARSKAEGSGYTRIHGNAEVRAQGGDYAAGIGTGNEPHKLAVNGVWPKLYDIKIYESAKVYATGGKEAAGIGCGNEGQRSAGAAGKLEISDNAEVTAQGGKYGAGIGGGDQNVNGTVNIKGGTVNATGGYGGAGIGGGDDADDDSSAGDINISGGTVNANGGDYGAGIGAGDTSDMKCKLEITGGKVTATAGKEAAGIGGGNHTYFSGGGKGGTVKIELPKAAGSEDYVLALSGEGAAPIGHGNSGDSDGTLNMGNDKNGNLLSVRKSNSKVDYNALKDETPVNASQRISECKNDYNKTVLIKYCRDTMESGVRYTSKNAQEHYVECPYCDYLGEECHEPAAEDDHACTKCGGTVTCSTVTYNDQSGNRNQYITKDTYYILPQPSGQAPTGQRFAGWCEKDKESMLNVIQPGDTDYADFDTKTWVAMYGRGVDIVFDLGGASGTIPQMKLVAGMKFYMPDPDELGITGPEGARFLGWSDGQTTYQAGYRYVVDDQEARTSITITAQWYHEHDLTHHNAVAATCTKDGNIEYWVCKSCRKLFADSKAEHECTKDDVVIPKGHCWAEPVFSWSEDNLSVTAERICLNDSTHKETETAGATATTTDATCTATGKTEYAAEFTNPAFEKQTREVIIEKKPHIWSGWTSVEGDETQEMRTCRTCKTVEYRTKDHVHNLVKVEQVDPKCEKSGMKAYWKCVDGKHGGGCGKWYADADGNQEIPGDTEEARKASLVIPATGHTLGTPEKYGETTPATCEDPGNYKTIRKCTVDGCGFSTKNNPKVYTIPPLGHEWGKDEIIKPATCTEEGLKGSTCSRCGETRDPVVIPAIGGEHEWGDWVVIKPATSTKPGVRQHSCEKCGLIEQGTIQPTPAPTPQVNPAASVPVEIQDLPAVKISKPAKSKKAITVKWKKVSKKNRKKIGGIEIQISGPGVDKVVTAGKKKTSKKIKGLMPKQKYICRVRAYNYIDGVKHVSAWSGWKSTKTR